MSPCQCGGSRQCGPGAGPETSQGPFSSGSQSFQKTGDSGGMLKTADCRADPSHRPSECSPDLTSVRPLLSEPPPLPPAWMQPWPQAAPGAFPRPLCGDSLVDRATPSPGLPAAASVGSLLCPFLGDAEHVGPGSLLSPWPLPAASLPSTRPVSSAHLNLHGMSSLQRGVHLTPRHFSSLLPFRFKAMEAALFIYLTAFCDLVPH